MTIRRKNMAHRDSIDAYQQKTLAAVLLVVRD